AVPLVQEIDCRRHDQRGPARSCDGQQCEIGFARARGQDDDAPAATLPPCLQSFGLMWKRSARGPQGPWRRLVSPGFVTIRNLIAAQKFDDGSIMPGFRSHAAGASIDPTSWQGEQALLGSSGEHQRSAIESQQDLVAFHQKDYAPPAATCPCEPSRGRLKM